MGGNRRRLLEAVENLYATFDRYPLRATTEICWHCHSPEQERGLHAVPMRQMTPDALQDFASDSLMTWGGLGDLKHFLPRLLEIVALDHFTHDYPDIETVLGALERGEWSAWPLSEREAVIAFLRAFWTESLNTWPSHYEIETVISAIAEADADLSPYLAEWSTASGPAPVIHYSVLIQANASQVTLDDPLDVPWLDGHPDRERQVRSWLRTERQSFARKIELLLPVTDDQEVSAALRDALGVIKPGGAA